MFLFFSFFSSLVVFFLNSLFFLFSLSVLIDSVESGNRRKQGRKSNKIKRKKTTEGK